MRPLESLILLFCLAFVFSLVVMVRFGSRQVIAAALTGLVLFIAHLFTEGFRWHMLPAYFLLLFVVAWILLTGRKIPDPSSKSSSRIPGMITLLVWIFAWALPAYIFPVFTFEKPSGPFAVGTVARCLVGDPGQNNETLRRIMVQIWYPAEPGTGLGIASYHPNPEHLASQLADALSVPRLLFGNLFQVKTNTLLNADMSGVHRRFPVLLFSHGLNGYRFQNTFQVEELASHGYIVIAIDHPGFSSGTVFPDGRTFPVHQLAEFNEEELRTFVFKWVSDARFVLDYLAAINRADPDNLFTNRLDLSRIGYLGHSLGGTVAAEMLSLDGRIKAGLDMDGYPLGKAHDRKPKSTFMHLESDRSLSDISDKDLTALRMTRQSLKQLKEVWDRRTEQLCRKGFSLKLRGSRHFDFSDCPLWTPLASSLGLTGDVSPRRIHRIINDVTLAFFDTFLKDQPSPLLSMTASSYPEIEWMFPAVPLHGQGVSIRQVKT